MSLSVIGCKTEKTGYEKTIAAWEECMGSESEITTERRKEIEDRLRWKEMKEKYKLLFERQPHYLYSSYGSVVNEDTGERDWGRMGIRVYVTKKVDQSTLPEEDRIPDCLEGMPVQILEGEIEASTTG